MKSHFLIITGMSGAGKTQVVRTLEDLNFFCVDNLPAALITKFAELARQASENNVAVVVDIRGGQFFNQLLEVLEEMEAAGQSYELLFLDAEDDTLVRRYKETRRRHPLGEKTPLLKNIQTERELLAEVKKKATTIVDTTTLVNAELKNHIIKLYSETGEKARMGIVVRSFGFKHGLPLDSDLVLDVRFLPNPFYVDELRPLTGNDAPVADYICHYPQTYEFLKKEIEMLDFLVPQYINEGKSQLVISVGCTGGQHRSVFIANKIAEYLHTKGYLVETIHRDVQKNK